MRNQTSQRMAAGVLAAATAVTLLAVGCKGSRMATRDEPGRAMADFTVNLTGGQEVPSNQSAGGGTGAVKLSPERNVITYNFKVAGLSGPVTAAHFHRGGPGQSGPPVKTITVSSGGEAAGNWTMNDADQPLTRMLVDELLAGNLYINVHTANFSDGEIRGQVTNAAGRMTTPSASPH